VIDLVFETHSISEDNEPGVATGWLPGRLSERGRALARELGDRRRDSIDVVFVSDLARAVETATIAFEGSDIPVHEDARLRECNYGDLNGMPVAQLHATRANHVEDPYPNGQSYRDCVAAVASLLEDLRPYDGKRVLLIGHSATRRAIEVLLNSAELVDIVVAPFDWQPGWSYTVQF
jgi:alpha-ribazole phosphatase/probable phosphoglycerate mutase